jgi:hypothetical protein
MTTRLFPAATLAIMALTSACGRSSRQTTTDLTSNQPVVLKITNENVQDINVFLTQGGDRQRLGMVTTGQTQTFEIPANTLRAGNDLRVQVHPIGGGGDYETERILVNAGETISLQVAPLLNQSRMSVMQSES